VTAYLLATTIVIQLYGKLGDLFGRRWVLQTAVVIFLVGSVLCGFAQNLPELIVFRALQGLGGGGLIVTSVAVIGDIIPPRDRGRYQGFIGGSAVLGPLLGGYIVEHLTWRWIFFINVPLGLLALAVITATFKVQHRPSNVRIDYAGAALLALALLGMVGASSLGEMLFRAAPVSLLAIVLSSVFALAGFFYVERTVPDPMVPLSLFANRTFSVSVCIGFMVGMALFGSITLLPVYLQVVKGLDPTVAGFVMTPMMAGVLATSITSGQIISKYGRYKIFPVAGTAIMTTALLLLSFLEIGTPVLTTAFYMLLLGCGLGMVMQMLVMAVQNSVA
jgi:EmrB/QacA subfamily drug resistance transporter